MPRNDWDEYKKLFLHELRENGRRFEKVEAILSSLQSDVSGLKVKASLVGGAAGIIGTAMVQFIVRLWN